MSAQSATGIQSSGTPEVEQLMDAVDDENPLKPVVSALLDRVDQLEGSLEALSNGNEHAHERIDELDERSERSENAVDYAHSRIDDVEADSGDANPTLEPDRDGSSTVKSGKSPLEQLTNLPEHSVDEQLTENQQRARSIAMDVEQYADRTPKGLVVSSSTVSKVLAAQEDGTPHTQTVSRVMDFLDEFGREDVETRMHKGRRIAVFNEQAVKGYSTNKSKSHSGVMSQRASG